MRSQTPQTPQTPQRTGATAERPTRENCGCDGFRISRRSLLQSAAVGTGVLATSGLFDGAFRQVAYGAERGNNVLVVLSLRGGADGLSLVVPRGADHDLLRSARPRTVVPEASLVGGDTAFGLHPAFAPLLPMWAKGRFGAVHAVGLPAPNRSHFAAMEVIEDADPGSSRRVGWINRMTGLEPGAPAQRAVQLGSALLPTSLSGPAAALGVASLGDLDVATLGGTARRRRRSVRTMWAADRSPLGKAMRSAMRTAESLSGVAASASTSVHPSAFPEGELRSVLANTSALIRADVGARVVTVDYGDWDMHVGMVDGDADPTKGWMHDQVSHLAKSLAAFFADLGPAASRVTVVTISEFGRRLRENDSRGLDHGYGNVMLLLGAGVQGGRVHGGWPGLAELADGDLGVRQDFRSVLWEVLADRFPDVTGSRNRVFPGFTPSPVGVMT